MEIGSPTVAIAELHKVIKNPFSLHTALFSVRPLHSCLQDGCCSSRHHTPIPHKRRGKERSRRLSHKALSWVEKEWFPQIHLPLSYWPELGNMAFPSCKVIWRSEAIYTWTVSIMSNTVGGVLFCFVLARRKGRIDGGQRHTVSVICLSQKKITKTRDVLLNRFVPFIYSFSPSPSFFPSIPYLKMKMLLASGSDSKLPPHYILKLMVFWHK